MPLTPDGRKVLGAMKQQYGVDKGKQVFYASINAGKPGSAKWHKKKKTPGGRAREMLTK